MSAVFFEAKEGKHSLSYKFENGSRIIDIMQEPASIVLNVCASFIKQEKTQTRFFDEMISIGEDAKYVTDILLEKKKYGIVDTAKYNVRKRFAGTSITQKPNISKYTLTMDRYYCEIARMSNSRFGRVIPYVQYAIANGIKYRLHGAVPDELHEHDREQYIETVIELVRMLDDDVIMNMPNASVFTKIYMLEVKFGANMADDISFVGDNVMFRGNKVGKMPANTLTIGDVWMNGNEDCIVSGRVNWFNGVKKIHVFCSAGTLETGVVQQNINLCGK